MLSVCPVPVEPFSDLERVSWGWPWNSSPACSAICWRSFITACHSRLLDGSVPTRARGSLLPRGWRHVAMPSSSSHSREREWSIQGGLQRFSRAARADVFCGMEACPDQDHTAARTRRSVRCDLSRIRRSRRAAQRTRTLLCRIAKAVTSARRHFGDEGRLHGEWLKHVEQSKQIGCTTGVEPSLE